MRKKCILFVLIMMTFSIVISSVIRFTYADILKNDKEKLLTKNCQFDIIDNVGNIILTSMTTLGEKNLSTQSKIDATIMYILYNKERYKEDFIENNNSLVMDKGKFYTILNSLFECSELNLDEYINISLGNINYSYLDNYEIVKTDKIDNCYIIYTKYSRQLNDINNYVYVKYEVTQNMKIRNVSIIESIIV